jgi:ataxia telangiectasia mutated family protein
MVNRSVRYITGKTFSAVLTHLTQAMVHRGTFLEPLALDYIKSIKILLSRPEHLAHLTDDMWAGLMTLCWNAALGLPLDTSTDGWGYEATSNQDMEIDELDSATAPGGKLSAQAIELMSLVPMLLSSDSAPLLPAVAKPADVDDVVHRAGVPILRHIVNFLERYKIETSAHRSVLMGLNLLLAELELNYITEMRRAGGKLVPSLVTLLRDTRSMDTREHILLALRTLLPYVSANTKSPSFSAEPLFVSKEVAESVGKLVEILSKECWSGLRGAALPMMSFQFAVDQSASAPSAKGKEKEVGPVVLQDDSPFSSRLMKVRNCRLPPSSVSGLIVVCSVGGSPFLRPRCVYLVRTGG